LPTLPDMAKLTLTSDPEADALLSTNPLALLIGMLLDQQVPMEWAFSSPKRLEERLGKPLTAANIAGTDPDDLDAIFRDKPALHRYPGSMAKRVHALCAHLVESWDGQADALWRDVDTGKELFANISSLPGYGKQKAQIFCALLAKQLGVAPDGWQDVTGDYGKEGHRSIADVTSPESLAEVRNFKKLKKATTTT